MHCIIVCESNKNSNFGILENMRRADDLEPYNGLIEFDPAKATEFVSLRTVCIS